MRKYGLFILAVVFICFNVKAGTVDSAYLFAYATKANEGRSGLHFAWSRDKAHWQAIGQEYGFLKSDYGRWGSEKRMINPVLFLIRIIAGIVYGVSTIKTVPSLIRSLKTCCIGSLSLIT